MLMDSHFLAGPHMADLSLPLLRRPPILSDWGPTPMTSFNCDHLLKVLSPNTVTLGFKLQHMDLMDSCSA